MPWLKLFPLLLTLLSFLQPLAANASTLLLPLAAAESAGVSTAHRDAVSFCRSTAKDSAAHSDAPGASAFAVVDGTATAVYSFYAAIPSAAAIMRNAEASGQGVITAIHRAGLAGEEAGALAEEVGATGAAKLPAPKTPGGMKLPEFGKVMNWGTGHEAARSQIPNLTREGLQNGGVTLEIAENWGKFYRNEALRNPSNPSALGRAELMEAAADLLR